MKLLYVALLALLLIGCSTQRAPSSAGTSSSDFDTLKEWSRTDCNFSKYTTANKEDIIESEKDTISVKPVTARVELEFCGKSLVNTQILLVPRDTKVKVNGGWVTEDFIDGGGNLLAKVSTKLDEVTEEGRKVFVVETRAINPTGLSITRLKIEKETGAMLSQIYSYDKSLQDPQLSTTAKDFAIARKSTKPTPYYAEVTYS